MKALVFAGILSIAAASAVQAGGHSTSGDFHANAVPACDTEKCPMLAGDTGPGGPGDDNGRSMASNTADGRPLILAASKPNSGGNINL